MNMNSSHAFEPLVQAGIEQLKSHQIYQDFMQSALKCCKTFADEMAKEMVRLHEKGLLCPVNILVLQNYEGPLKYLTNAIIELKKKNLLNPDNLAILAADNMNPDQKARALIILTQHNHLTNKTRSAVFSYKKNPIILAKIIGFFKHPLSEEILDILLKYDSGMNELHDGLKLLNQYHFDEKYRLNLLIHKTPMHLAKAFILLKSADLEIEPYHALLTAHINPDELASAMIALHRENILDDKHLQLLCSANDLIDITKKIRQPHLLTKAFKRGFACGLFSGSTAGALMWGFATAQFLQITMLLGLLHPVITLAVLALTCALILALACYLTQNNINQSLKF